MIGVSEISVLRALSISGSGSGDNVVLSKRQLAKLLRIAIEKDFDEEWYLERYPDVSTAKSKGLFASGIEHYCTVGIYEGRLPRKLTIDERAYLARHKDVAAAIKTKAIGSASEHFEKIGYLEGRSFSLTR